MIDFRRDNHSNVTQAIGEGFDVQDSDLLDVVVVLQHSDDVLAEKPLATLERRERQPKLNN